MIGIPSRSVGWRLPHDRMRGSAIELLRAEHQVGNPACRRTL